MSKHLQIKISIMKERNICFWDTQQRSLSSMEVKEDFPEEVKLVVRSSEWKGLSDIKGIRNRQVSACKGGKESERTPNRPEAEGKKEKGRGWYRVRSWWNFADPLDFGVYSKSNEKSLESLLGSARLCHHVCVYIFFTSTLTVSSS